jgi:hypothetical protein
VAEFTACFYCFLAWITLWPWRWRTYVPLKHWALCKLYGVTTQMTTVFILATMRTSNPTLEKYFKKVYNWALPHIFQFITYIYPTIQCYRTYTCSWKSSVN